MDILVLNRVSFIGTLWTLFGFFCILQYMSEGVPYLINNCSLFGLSPRGAYPTPAAEGVPSLINNCSLLIFSTKIRLRGKILSTSPLPYTPKPLNPSLPPSSSFTSSSSFLNPKPRKNKHHDKFSFWRGENNPFKKIKNFLQKRIFYEKNFLYIKYNKNNMIKCQCEKSDLRGVGGSFLFVISFYLFICFNPTPNGWNGYNFWAWILPLSFIYTLLPLNFWGYCLVSDYIEKNKNDPKKIYIIRVLKWLTFFRWIFGYIFRSSSSPLESFGFPLFCIMDRVPDPNNPKDGIDGVKALMPLNNSYLSSLPPHTQAQIVQLMNLVWKSNMSSPLTGGEDYDLTKEERKKFRLSPEEKRHFDYLDNELKKNPEVAEAVKVACLNHFFNHNDHEMWYKNRDLIQKNLDKNTDMDMDID